MTDVMEPEEFVTGDEFALAPEDTGGEAYTLFVSEEEPDHDPFADYPDGPPAEPDDEAAPAPALLGIPMQVSARLAHNLDVRRQKIWACWGKGVQVGWIGDTPHQGECSDHNKDSTGVVHAIDVMVTGSRAKVVVDQMLAHSGDLQYVIHNRVIWSASSGWKPRKYTGPNPHTDHVHGSGKHGGSGKNGSTCTGYDRAAEKVTPVFDICPAPKPPAPKPPAPAVKVGDPGTRMLQYVKGKPLMTGKDVLFVQHFIGKPCGDADGKFGPQTAAGVRWYRNQRGLKVVGVVDEATWKQMGVKWRG